MWPEALTHLNVARGTHSSERRFVQMSRPDEFNSRRVIRMSSIMSSPVAKVTHRLMTARVGPTDKICGGRGMEKRSISCCPPGPGPVFSLPLTELLFESRGRSEGSHCVELPVN
jgi:hypothetical protein